MIDESLFEIRIIKHSSAAAFVTKHHYTKNISRSVVLSLALMYKEKYIVGVCSFGIPISESVRSWPFGEEHKDVVVELHRLAMLRKKDWKARPPHILSWFVSRCLKTLVKEKEHIRCVVSFADSTQGHLGIIYRALNAYYFGLVTRRSKALKDENEKIKSSRSSGKQVTYKQIKEKGLEVVQREKKYKYLWIIGPDRREVKKWRKMLKHKRCMWVKRPTTKHKVPENDRKDQ